jgi:hypothetical protein
MQPAHSVSGRRLVSQELSGKMNQRAFMAVLRVCVSVDLPDGQTVNECAN